MHSFHMLCIAAVAGVLTLASAAQAAPPAPPVPVASNALTLNVHGCHDSWRRGRIERRGRDDWGWHRHSGRHCRTVVGRSYDRRHRPRDWNRRGCFQAGPVTICP